MGVRFIPFKVRNGPGIAVSGLNDHDVLEGSVPVLINFYGGSGEAQWEPSRAETPAPIPTWTWVLFIAIAAFGVFYAVSLWNPPAQFAQTLEAASSPPKTGAVNDSSSAIAELGNKVYLANCAACHQADGRGLTNTFPPLIDDPVVNAADPEEHIKIVLHGLQAKPINNIVYASPMPAWETQLSDDQIAAVINHERSSWGNHAPNVTSQDVARFREQKKP
jgi:mono/diheme cytochrome c family protein